MRPRTSHMSWRPPAGAPDRRTGSRHALGTWRYWRGCPSRSRRAWRCRVAAGDSRGGVGPADGGLLEAVDDVLQRHIALQALQAALVERDDVAAGGALEGGDGLERLGAGAVRDQDAVGAVEAQAVGAGQQEGVLKQFQADWTRQLGLQCFHLQLNRSKGDIKSHRSWSVTCAADSYGLVASNFSMAKAAEREIPLKTKRYTKSVTKVFKSVEII